MARAVEEKKGGNRKVWLMVLSGVLIVAAGVVLWGQIAHYTRGIEPEPQERAGGPMGRPSREEMRQVFTAAMDEIGLTDEQRTQIAEMDASLPQGREGWRERRQRMDEILTPEQHEKMRDYMRNVMRERMSEVLSPKDMAALEKRFAERRARREGGGPRPEGR